MKRIINLPLLLVSLLTIFNACKPDCERGLKLTQDYKYYQDWYPYKEFDTLHFYRIPEQDTIILYGSEYKYPYYIRTIACECCDDEKNEYLQQDFKDKSGAYEFRVDMDGRIFTFMMFKEFKYVYDLSGSNLLYEEVITPDSTYKQANRLNRWIQSCYYSRKIGVVKYVFDSTHSWLFLRKK